MELNEQGALALSGMIARREVSAAELMAATLARIAAVNGPLNALISLRDADTLLAEARAADDAAPKGWLHGIPVAVKDIWDAEGLPTVQGSPLLTDHIATSDGAIAARLRAAGAIVIGKTNVPEFALGSHTYNPVFGATANPYAPGHTAGGSSGGAAVALAARMLAVADGTDMMGSLRNPAGWNNVYGFRPTWGRITPEATGDTYLHGISTPGPMARDPADLLALLNTLAAPDPAWPGAPWPPLDGALDGDLTGRRIAWLGDWGGAFPYEPGIREAVEAALRVLMDLGATVEEIPPPAPRELLWDSWLPLRAFGISETLAPFLDDPAHRDALKPAARWEAERGRALTAAEIQRASEGRSAWLRTALALFKRFDAFVLPTSQVLPFPVNLDWPKEIAGTRMDTYHRWMEVMLPVSLIGLPALGAPAGFAADGRPVGLQIAGPPGADLDILRIGAAYHRATDWPSRRPPPL